MRTTLLLGLLLLGACGGPAPLIELHGRPAIPMTSRWQHDAQDAAEHLEELRRRQQPPASDEPELRKRWIEEALAQVEAATGALDRLNEAGLNERLYAAVVWGTIVEQLIQAWAPDADLADRPDLQRVLAPYARLAHGAFQVCAAQSEALYYENWARYCEARATQYGWSRQVALRLIRPPELGEAMASMPDPAWPPGAALDVLRIMPDEDEDDWGDEEAEAEGEEEEEEDPRSRRRRGRR